ncbi:MAG TPA: hypothetical protein VF066_09750 [Thermoleophilaceae bacterium]
MANLLIDDKLPEFLDLARASDSVELKLTVPLDQRRTALTALGLDPLGAQVRLISFFDTPDLALERAGLIVRARRKQGKPDDSTIKLRPVVPDALPPELRSSPALFVELDIMPGGYVTSAAFKGLPRKASVHDVHTGAAPLRKLFSKEQRAFYAEHAPSGIGLDDLTLLGPLFALKLQGTPPGFGRKVVAELWLYPDGSQILELSTKSEPGEALQAAGEARAFLLERGVDLSGDQQTKTRTALEFFSNGRPRS